MNPKQFRPSRPKRVLKLAREECADAENLIVLAGATVAVAVTRDRIKLRSFSSKESSPGLRGEKEISIGSLSSVQFRRHSVMTRGFLHFVVPGDFDVRRGTSFDPVKDDNTVIFDPDDVKDFEYLCRFVLQLIADHRRLAAQPSPEPNASVADELSKLHSLLLDGVVSQAEFDQAKRRLLAGEFPATTRRATQHSGPEMPTRQYYQHDVNDVGVRTRFDDSAEPRGKKSGCLRLFGVVVLIAIAFSAWATYEESLGTKSMVEGWLYLEGDTAVYRGDGRVCSGAGGYAFIDMDTPINVSAGGSKDLNTILAAGTAIDRLGSCSFPFFGELRYKSEYEITIGNGRDSILLNCPIRYVRHLQGEDGPVLQIEIQIDSGGAKCVNPAF